MSEHQTTTLRATVRYDGSGFAGWQKQPHARTVQGELEAAMSRIANQPVRIQGAGRTDAGVHAFGQVFSCKWPGPFPVRLRTALSRMLGPEIRLTEVVEAAPNFNARFDAVAKRYAYSLDLGRDPDPFVARYAWHVLHEVDLGLLRDLLKRLEGEHDFAGFQSTGSTREHTRRTIYSAELLPGAVCGPCDLDYLWRLAFHGDGFLYHMVRNITGTVVEIARGRYPDTFLDELLASQGPFPGYCAPAHGLTMVSVEYAADAPLDG
ncbi:tRNA pseudouridine(38-40) synthase TruA [Roseovarius pacificus]|uniref:tRNA pseudouridine(38-40) synthase TruA n=1 Tax=Roseovarius pacificus TaxID=337701 RepID=UPI002A1895D2|nr:tRNA pseudouridine(38-40) synthase TruA [Roseovarius pacificus]